MITKTCNQLFHKMRLGGSARSTIEAFGGDVIAASAFDGVIKAADHDTLGDAHGHEEPEQQPTRGERRPDGAMQDTMIRLKVRDCTASHHLEHRRHSPFPWCKDGARHQDFHMLPHGSRKDWCKDPNGTTKGDRQGAHRHPFG